LIEAKAPGKLILIGEYAVLEGAPAVVMAVNRYATTSIKISQTNKFNVNSTSLKGFSCNFAIQQNGELKFSSAVLKNQLDKLNYFIFSFREAHRVLKAGRINLPPLDITLDTADFFQKETGNKLGLGSSAALSVALYGGLLSYPNQEMQLRCSKNDLFNAVNSMHRLAQGQIGSGIDVAASVFGGALKYQLVHKKKPSSGLMNQIDIPSDLHILPVWTEQQASTKEMVTRVNSFHKKDKRSYKRFIDEMSELSQLGCDMLTQNSTIEFMKIVHDYHQVLKRFGDESDTPIISDAHQRIADIVYFSGNAVYKSSGAGGGDFGIVFSQSEDELDYLKNQIVKEGFKIFDLGLSKKGFHISL